MRDRAGKSTLLPRCEAIPLAAWNRPTLSVVIDTEEEFDWAAPFDARATATQNIKYQPLAQEIMDRHGVIPTYVVDYPVADTPSAASVLRAIADSGRCEIGAHLHPWVNPPHEGPIDEFTSYPGNLPENLEREKLSRLAARIEESFGRRPRIYKAGRYGLGPASFRIIADLGFEIDTSIVPHTDFSLHQGPDFTSFPSVPMKGPHGLTVLPLSVHFVGRLASLGDAIYPSICAPSGAKLKIPAAFSRLGFLERLRLSPEGFALDDMIRQTRSALASGERYFMLTYHSSSLLPGKNSYVRSEEERRQFLSRIGDYFSFFLQECNGEMASISEVAGRLRKSA
jgi:hypothetical protein